MNPDAPLSVTFPDDRDATARIIQTDPMANQIVERYADRKPERPDDLADAVCGRTVAATAAELGLLPGDRDPVVETTFTFEAGEKKA